jgi:hypothetical protein
LVECAYVAPHKPVSPDIGHVWRMRSLDAGRDCTALQQAAFATKGDFPNIRDLPYKQLLNRGLENVKFI